MICGAEVASWIAHDGAIEVFECFNHILTEAILVGEGIPGVIDSAVDATAHVLCETSIGVVLDLGDFVSGVNGDDGLLAIRDLGVARHSGQMVER